MSLWSPDLGEILPTFISVDSSQIRELSCGYLSQTCIAFICCIYFLIPHEGRVCLVSIFMSCHQFGVHIYQVIVEMRNVLAIMVGKMFLMLSTINMKS